ncbi:CDF-like metal transporter [Laetiporus sulphureus 93-53]|uniref:CDF-like metal transporter n=1 Tax=Laetiporus sulphureus 93-53 TaxID=1314785 RepID=A0A165FC22_9APHY|nr:CDF-like metal transporter [Laetiporus sulphureus 93-53]KZT08742.1 CDF-like metal transporter [Laetiporus sulphureus 93-53]
MVIVQTTEENVLSVRPGFLSLYASQPEGAVSKQQADVEQPRTTVTREEHPDPYSLRKALKTDDELASLRKRKAGKQLERFHRKQNDIKVAIWASLAGNFALCILQLYAAITSVSLSLITTSVDSVFDFGSNVVLYWLHKRAMSLDLNKWPVGGLRLETIGNIVYGFLMSAVNLVLIVESVQRIITHDSSSDTDKFHIPSIISVGAALGVKFVLFVYCSGLRKQSSQVHVLWEDHRNDLFVNGFGLLMSAGGSKWVWFLDPMGALIISIGVLLAWGKTIYEQFELLAGKSAPYEFMQLLVYKTMTFSDEIEKVDTVRAYHSGPDYFVEIDIVMDASTPLWKAHDISQQLQDKIEVLPNVERAFVHVDHETTHAPEHRKYL